MSKKQNKRLNGWKLNREGFRIEAGEKDKEEDSVVLSCDRISSVLGRGWTRGSLLPYLLPSGFYWQGSILSGAEEFPCSPALRSVLLFPKEAGCQLLCALLVIPADSLKGSAFTGMWSNCCVQEQGGVVATRAPSTMTLFGCLQMSSSKRLS